MSHSCLIFGNEKWPSLSLNQSFESARKQLRGICSLLFCYSFFWAGNPAISKMYALASLLMSQKMTHKKGYKIYKALLCFWGQFSVCAKISRTKMRCILIQKFWSEEVIFGDVVCPENDMFDQKSLFHVNAFKIQGGLHAKKYCPARFLPPTTKNGKVKKIIFFRQRILLFCVSNEATKPKKEREVSSCSQGSSISFSLQEMMAT